MSNNIHGTESLNFVNFNQDGTCIAIGTSNGYKIFNSSPFGVCYSRVDQGGIGIIEMLFQTSLVVISGIGDQPSMSPRRLKIINTKKNSTICELTFPTTILAIKLNKSRIVILLEEQIYIYDINNMKLLHTIETSPNTNGLCALSATTDHNYFAYPSPPRHTNLLNSNNGTNISKMNDHHHDNSNGGSGSSDSRRREGDVIVFDAQTLQPAVVIEAHKTSIAALTISYDGTLLASASDKGTIVRVFDIESGTKLFQFRRGTYPTKIHSLSFSRDNRYLTASSSTETVHIFKLGDKEQETAPEEASNDSNTSSSTTTASTTAANTRLSAITETPSNSTSSDSSNSRPTERRVSNSSFESINSNDLDQYEPLVDVSRRTMGRLIRKSSQSIGRKAAERIGSFLPPKFTSILEPNRHFASLKIPAQTGVKNVVSIGKEIKISKSGLPFYKNSNVSNGSNGNLSTMQSEELSNSAISSNSDDGEVTLIHVLVVSSEGYFYNYGLDPERGGDCILLNQYSLTDGQ
ncbi:hypothetical protein WICPIJ_001969 [Wickerhamomyces pijperi]|uniref:Autophagy-related protein 18 n=1 Tax=Wickerhamomyces pijperi TaxID=599730 RepID=A0A9P8QCL9_WICPI|nr:hypothetical protein WICPIJ_001969 [Wickerhamomyces pijperi]